ncbi:970_t:CDS:1, partial [Acaulospora colombiana]
VNRLIEILHIWAKKRAIQRVGTVVISYRDVRLQQQQYRYILRSISKHQHSHPFQRLYNHKTSTQSFLQFLNNWLHRRVEDGSTLDQYEIAMLIQGLSSLSLRVRHREPTLLHELDTFIHMLSRHASSQVAILSRAEAYLDRLKGATNLPTSSQSKDQLEFLRSLMRESSLQLAQNWTEKDEQNDISFTSLARLARKARVLKILIRSRLHSGDVSSVCRYMKDMTLVHRFVSANVSSSRLKQASAGIGPTSPLNRFNAKRFVVETQLRFTGALVLTSSNLLMAQDVSGLFSVLYFTRYLGSIYTFVRLWKRAIYLVAKQGKWEGATGLKALLSLLGESLPSGWDKSIIGSLLFDSPELVISTLRTVLQAPRSIVITLRPVPMDKDNFQLEGRPLAGVHKQSFDDWWQLVIPFGVSQWLPNALRPLSERIDDGEGTPLKGRSFEEMNGMLLKKIQRH